MAVIFLTFLDLCQSYLTFWLLTSHCLTRLLKSFFAKSEKYFHAFIIGQRKQKCTWTRQRLDSSGKPLGYGPIYDWSCEPLSKNASIENEKCQKRCHEHKNCQDCLDSSGGAEGGMFFIAKS